MILVGRDIISAFIRRHGDARSPLEAWVAEVENADWTGPTDVKARYPSASLLSGNEVIFNIKGNRYRLKVIIAYATKLVAIQRIGTHAEYNRW